MHFNRGNSKLKEEKLSLEEVKNLILFMFKLLLYIQHKIYNIAVVLNFTRKESLGANNEKI